jgi:hypothetical protein
MDEWSGHAGRPTNMVTFNEIPIIRRFIYGSFVNLLNCIPQLYRRPYFIALVCRWPEVSGNSHANTTPSLPIRTTWRPSNSYVIGEESI